MFKPLTSTADKLTEIFINGQPARVQSGISVAAAVLGQNLRYTRSTPVSGAKRAPFCLMGVCYDCLMVIDGIPNQRACTTYVKDGMHIEIQDKTGCLPSTGEHTGE
ncbi:(2Fe-2S)-binding protein [methane-oxidizing endosymbiont of Gigantopelta aegis]|uniref:(2Fe-2S)-binding protein n=1 Tax=methane-oxidizing endosymbiont of Gigantopelta aegis TaxID=2794938 RepID=UPI0018DC4145|nr:(2Fe-2S)-binding protein [methane-oxidizing endosymbiont of Gigantopelta aegis]